MYDTLFLLRQNEANTHWMLIVSTSCPAAYNGTCIRDNLFPAREQIISHSGRVSWSRPATLELIKNSLYCAKSLISTKKTRSLCLYNEVTQKSMQSISRKHHVGEEEALWKSCDDKMWRMP